MSPLTFCLHLYASQQYCRDVRPKLSKQEVEDGPGDFTVDEKSKQTYFTEEGHDHIEQLLVDHGVIQEGQSLYDLVNISILHHLLLYITQSYHPHFQR